MTAHEAVDIGAIESRAVELNQLRKHLTMLFGQNSRVLQVVHLRNGSQRILCIGVISYLESADFSVIFWQPVPFAHGRESTARIAGRVR